MADTIRTGIVGATVTQGSSGWGANASFGCVPPFTHGVFHGAVQLMMPAVIHAPPRCVAQPAI